MNINCRISEIWSINTLIKYDYVLYIFLFLFYSLDDVQWFHTYIACCSFINGRWSSTDNDRRSLKKFSWYFYDESDLWNSFSLKMNFGTLKNQSMSFDEIVGWKDVKTCLMILCLYYFHIPSRLFLTCAVDFSLRILKIHIFIINSQPRQTTWIAYHRGQLSWIVFRLLNASRY